MIIETILYDHCIECTGLGEVTCRGCRDKGWMSWHAYHAHLVGLIRAELGGDEVVEAVARSLAGLEPGEGWPTNADLGGNPTGTRDDEYRDACYNEARAALAAVVTALGGDRG